MLKNYLSKQKIPFTMVCNQIILDVRISSKAKFYYTYLSSKPEGWEFHTNAIVKEIKEGRDAFYSGLQELEEFGYLERTQKRVGGKFSATEYMLLIPSNLSDTENPDTEKSDTENPDHNNIYSNKKDLNKKDCNAVQSNFSKNSEEISEAEFEHFVKSHFQKASISIQDSTIAFVRYALLANKPITKQSVLEALETCINTFPESYGIKEVSNSSEIPNNSPIAKNTIIETYEPLSITEEEYITEWKKTNDKAEPSIGFKRNYENFKRCCNVNVQKEHGGWKNYLANEWIPKEKYLKYSDNLEIKDKRKGKKTEISEPYENKPPAIITLTRDLKNEPETFQALNQKFHEGLKGGFSYDAYEHWLKDITIVGFEEKNAILLVQTKERINHLYIHYQNRLKTIIKKVCEKHFKKDGFRLHDYKCVIEEELTKTTTII